MQALTKNRLVSIDYLLYIIYINDMWSRLGTRLGGVLLAQKVH